eukprot:7376168-Prymnesium_polylepis.1
MRLLPLTEHPVGLASICRVIDAGCAQLRREKRLGESVRVLRTALEATAPYDCYRLQPRLTATHYAHIRKSVSRPLVVRGARHSGE